MSDHQGGVGPQPPSHSLNVGPGQTVRLQQVLTTGTTQNLNVLSSRGQQFVITSQVPGLTQVIPTIATSNATIQQGGTTRIINIAPSRRLSVLGVPQGHAGSLQLTSNNANGSELPGRGTVSLVAIGQPTMATVSSSHPTLVSSLSSPPRQRATTPAGRPGVQQAAVPRKRARLSDLQERPPPNEEVAAMRHSVQEQKTIRMRELCEQYAEHAAEAFFLQAGGNMMDYHIWRKKPSTPQFLHFLRTHRLDPDDDDEDLTQQLSATVANASQNADLKVPSSVSSSPSPVQVSTSFVTNDTTAATTGTNSVSSSLRLSSQTTAERSLPPSSVVKHKTSTVSVAPRFHARQHSISALYDNSIGSQEQIAEKAKQEAHVMQRILELQKEGLWSEKRLPKVQEPPRAKAHWDYLIEEMVWLAADFAQERKWKKAAAKKCARNVQKYFQEKEAQAQKAEKIQELRLKKIAGFMAKEVKTFWANVEKLVEYKQQTRLEEKRKKALDQHLSFIVDQTEKYSNWLAESMNKGGDSTNVSVPASVASSRLSSPSRRTTVSDDEFQPNQSSTDDEETIAKAEEDTENQNHSEEIEMLKRESEIPLEDLLKELPEDYLQSRDTNSNEEFKKDETDSEKADDEFIIESDKESTDDEETIQEQEATEGNVDHKKELAELQAESELSIEDLLAKYKGSLSADDTVETEVNEMSEVDTEEDDEDDNDDVDNDDDNGEESQSEDEAAGSSSEEGTEIGLKTLLDEQAEMKDEKIVDNETAGKEINDVAALAESIQPKGNTLSSTSVVTPIPFLLKHSLREYQHIGLDWLVTMFDRKLNGILADEMGLGKTIQTISLLAHLACEKGNWGPHLIIVPTSVMLNWEMEFKKWCPAFKILTYYGSQKERKQKRTGWTKPNAFHVCITSYKLVIQDHQSFRRKKWKYLILDEAQNIKNFKSQRWQLLLNFQTQRRLLLTGTPLQNNLMELWSLMHFLMPNVFQSHREFKEWFSNPVTGMIEGNSEYNESIIKRLHKVLRPFLLRRLKIEVEKQLPKKYEHVVMCRLSKRQRFLYDDFMSRAKTRETLASGNLLSVINVLMQLRKVCNHPNLFEARPTISPFQMEGLTYTTASLVSSALDYDPFKHVDLFYLNLLLLDLELCLTAFVAHRIKKYQAPKKLIEEIDTKPDPAPRCPAGKIKIHVRLSTSQQQQPPSALFNKAISNIPIARVGTSPSIVAVSPQVSGQGITLRVPSTGTSSQAYAIQLVNQEGTMKAVPVTAAQNQLHQQQHQIVLQPNSIQVQQSKPVDGIQKIPVSAGFAQIVQSSGGRHILLTSSAQIVQPLSASQTVQANSTGVLPNGQRVTVLSKSVNSSSVSSSSVNRIVTSSTSARPVMRVPPLNVNTVVHSNHSSANSVVITGTTTLTTTTTSTSTKTSAVLTQPVLAALVQQTRNNVTSKSLITLTGGSLDLDGIKSLVSTNHKQETDASKDSVFYLPELNKKRHMKRREKLCTINMVNQRRCAACPIYGSDLVEAVRIVDQQCTSRGWKSSGYVHCQHAHRQCNRPEVYWNTTEALKAVIHTNTSYVEELKDAFSRFLLFVPAVAAPQPKFHVSHPPPSRLWEDRRFTAELQRELSPRCALLYPVVSAMATQFPDPRLIQYDCGKLQVLDKLLRHLKTEHHRVLIFTQMTKMLDVLEAFLNYHGHIYLRLDGTTRVDQRQLLMERFNADRRIFCFILSTRSGGIGVNLTGADTVIFYDSDWNPTMDAQAQDRCHRIGQTRDVHIYRLVSEMTVEENILKKANQKRLLGDLAIEGGNFTTAYFKKSTIQDLFNIDINEDDPSRRMAEILEKDNEKEKKSKDESQAPTEEKAALGALESALAAAEDESDVLAARTATAEAAADLAEFDESIPLEEAEGNAASGEQEISKAEQEVRQLEQQLTPVERYAMRFVEETEAAWSAEQLAAAEAEIEQQKREWELGRLQALKEEEERCAHLSEDEEEQPLTFSRVAAHNQVMGSTQLKEQLMMWCPPTPPQDENDVYIDHSLGFLYEQTIMSESQLPAVYVKKDFKRYRLDISPGSDRDARRPHKMRHREDSVYAPRSLFDRPSPALLKMRRDMKLQKYRGGTVRPMLSISSLKPAATVKQIAEPEHVPEWHIHEEWALLQAVQSFLQLPLNLMVLSPAHTPNWDMVSDIVNNVSCTYRSPKQCRNRYETVIVPREEGKVFYDTNPKKQKKTKGVYKLPPQTKAGRPLRTSQLFLQDNNSSFTSIYLQRFEVIKEMACKRKPIQKPQITPGVKNQRPPPIFLENGIDYDEPITPGDAASRRLERIARDKTKTLDQQEEQRRQQQRAQQQLSQQQQHQQQLVHQLRQQLQAAAAVAGTVPVPPATAASSLPTAVAATGSTVNGISSSAVAPVIATSSSPSASSSLPIVVTTVTSVTAATVVSSVVNAIRNARTVTASVSQDGASGQVRTVTSSTPIVSVAGLTPAQVQAATQRLVAQSSSAATSSATAVVAKGVPTVTGSTTKTTITQAQLQLYRQQALLRQQRIATQQLKVLQAQAGQKVSVAMTAGGVTTVQVSQAQQQRAQQLIKHHAAATAVAASGKQTVTRAVPDSEMAAMFKRQQLIVQQQKAQQVQVSTQGNLTPAHFLAQVQQAGTSGQTQVATLVKAVSAAGGSQQSVTIPVAGVTIPQVKALTPGTMKATPQQMRQLALQQQQLLQQRKMAGQKVAQLTQVANKAGVPTQLIVQSQKTLPSTMTVQHIQQVIKQVQPQTVQQFTHASGAQTLATQVSGSQVYSLAKGTQVSGATLHTRMLPVAGNQQTLKQIQVVAAPNVRSSVPNVTIDSCGRPQVSVASTLSSALANTIKVAQSGSTVQQQAILSQVSAALQGQTVPVTVRQTSQSPVRIQAATSGTAPLVAVAVQPASQVTHTQAAPGSSNDTVQ
uniref:Helicase domino n=1 Tax=Schistocerca gregaria TaxID=7010 RepID=A0A8E5JSW3_SCHGR|nr:Helicase domino [Schistocerca gregaria]